MMQNLDIARTFGELADLLEIRGANPFRIRAYRNAVQTINGLSRPLVDMVDDGEDLTELQGIGDDLSSYIEELVTTGELTIMDEVTEEVPRSLVELVRLDGVGPKKAKKLWQELDVTTVEALEAALEQGRVQELDGFGKKSAEKIARSIEDYRKHTGRMLLSQADEIVQPLLEYLESGPGVVRLEVAGSYRRRQETVGDLDVLALCDGPGSELMDHFTSYGGVDRVERAGDTRGTIVLRSGISVDLRIVPEESYGAALHYFTGSKEHNVEIRKLGVKKGLRVNEYGVFEVPDHEGPDGGASGGEAPGDPDAENADPRSGTRVGGATEEEVFESVGLPWIPPVLRTNRGEIKAARDGTLPELVELEDMKGDLQMHSTWSDGKQSIREMAEACRERGYEYMAITDHSQAMAMVQGLTPERAREQWLEIEELRDEVEGIRILKSAEVDILKDGSLDLPDEILEGMDLVVVSVHSLMSMSRSDMTERVLRAVNHPEVDILAHPTGRLLNRRQPFEVDVEEVLRAAAENEVAVELNANPRRLDLSDVHVYRARELGAKVVISTDAHSVRNLDLMAYGVDQARRGWLEKGDVLNALPWEEFEDWMRRREG